MVSKKIVLGEDVHDVMQMLALGVLPTLYNVCLKSFCAQKEKKAVIASK